MSQTLLLTRPKNQAAETISTFEKKGFRVLHIPLIEIVDPSDHYAGLDHALANLATYHWIIFTSQNAVIRFFARPLTPSGAELSQRIAAVGTATATLLRELDIAEVVIAKEQHAEGLLAALQPYDMYEKNILFPRAQEGREVLVKGLQTRGAKVDVVAAYRTVPARDLPLERFAEIFRNDEVEAIHFASPSAVKVFIKLLEEQRLQKKMKRLTFFVIGPTTRAELEKYVSASAILQDES